VNGTVGELLQRCRAAGLALLTEGGALHVEFEHEPPTDLLDEIRCRKPEVIAALSAKHGFAPHGARPHKKALTAGSDDHVLRRSGTVYTEVGGTLSPRRFERWPAPASPPALPTPAASFESDHLVSGPLLHVAFL